MSEPPIPAGPDAMTPQWLTTALRQSGAPADTTVESLEWTPLGRGRLSRIVRIRPDFARAGAAVPRSIIAKFDPLNPVLRELANPFAAAEIGFYRHLAAQPELRAPFCYYSAHDEETSRFALLIEDLQAAQRGFEQDTCTPEDAELALTQLAAFHAAWWSGRVRGRPAFLKRLERSEHAALQGPGLPALLTDNPAIDPKSQGSIQRDYALVRKRLSRGPLTVVLDDLHVGNLFFGRCGKKPTVTFIDFQFVCLARGPVDVARLLAGSLAVDARRAFETQLVGTYHDALTRAGVTQYELSECLRDYRLGLLWGLLRLITNNLVMTAISVDAPPYARTELARQIERFATAVDDLDCRDLLEG